MKILLKITLLLTIVSCAYADLSLETGIVLNKHGEIYGLGWFGLKSRLTPGVAINAALKKEGFIAPEILVKYSVPFSKHFRTDVAPIAGIRINKYSKTFFGALSIVGRYFLSSKFHVNVGTRIAMPFKTEENFEVGLTAGIEYRIGFKDSDKDWIPDKSDKCPNTPEDAFVNKFGCSMDSDGDGVYDGIDKCPETPMAALVDSFGCPTDSDVDGVFDGVDRCPDTPGHINVDSTGCPSDSDMDGVPDFADSCDLTPVGAIVDIIGCPRDTDEDGVIDGLDLCPKTPTGFEVDRFGCPRVPPIETEIVDNLYNNSLEITATALNILQHIALRLRAYPEQKITAKVYTDIEGSPANNRMRAKKIADKINEFFLNQGVKSETISFEPMGEKNPIIKKYGSEAMKKNRRIVFTIDNLGPQSSN